MKLKIVLGLLGTLQFILNSCSPMEEKEQKKPNILFLFTDDQRYGTIEALGHSELETPNMNRLVKNGVAFENAYILGSPNGAVCSPSRAMLMTGRHYFNIPRNAYTLWEFSGEERGNVDLLTFPEYFRQNGYTTFATGKQHNGKQWIERGFDKGDALFLGGMGTHFGLRVRDYDTTQGWGERYRRKDVFTSKLFANAAIDFLKDYRQEKPFLMYVSFTSPHDPRKAPEKYHQMYSGQEVSLPPNFMPRHPFEIADMKIRDEKLAGFPRTKEEIKEHIADYYAMITATDHHIGRILDTLRATGKMENTIIVFAGDNGLAVGQHGLMGKQNVYEHSVKIPFIFCGQGIPEGERREALVYLHDLFPTLCDLTGLEIPGSVHTKSIAEVIQGEKNSVRESIYFAYNHYKNSGKESQRGAHRAIRRGDLKLIISKKDGKTTVQLFNLEQDPYELNNLANKDDYKDEVEALKRELKNKIRESGDPAKMNETEFGLYPEE